MAVFGSQGILFTMKGLDQGYLVSSGALKGTAAIPLSCVQFPRLDSDFTLTLFYLRSSLASASFAVCDEIIRSAHYEVHDDGNISVQIHGVTIRQDRFGNVDVSCRPRTIRVSPKNDTVQIRTGFVDMAVQVGIDRCKR